MKLVVRNDLAELERVAEALTRFWAEQGLPGPVQIDVNLAIEEMLANVILHGYRDQAQHRIEVNIDAERDQVRVEIVDDGVHFNPLEAPPADLSAPLEKRRVGGLGIHLVRNLMDGMEYHRRGERNHLVLFKRVAPG